MPRWDYESRVHAGRAERADSIEALSWLLAIAESLAAYFAVLLMGIAQEIIYRQRQPATPPSASSRA